MEPGQDHLVRILALARRADCWESLDRLVVDEDPQASAARAKTFDIGQLVDPLPPAEALMELQESSDSKGDNTDLVMPECTKCELCVSRGEDHKSKDIFCKCSVCETLPKKAPKIFYKNEKVKIKK